MDFRPIEAKLRVLTYLLLAITRDCITNFDLVVQWTLREKLDFQFLGIWSSKHFQL